MTSVGYPDYGRGAQVASSLLNDNALSVGSNTYESSNVFTATWAWLQIKTESQTGTDYIQVKIRWYLLAGVDEVFDDTIAIAPGKNGYMQIPVRAPWFKVEITNLTQAGSQTVAYWVLGTRSAGSRGTFAQAGYPLIYEKATVNAGSDYIGTLTDTTPGPATLSIWHGANGNWSATVTYWDAGYSVQNDLMTFEGGYWGQGFTLPITLPPAPVALTLRNTDTAAQTMEATLTLA